MNTIYNLGTLKGKEVILRVNKTEYSDLRHSFGFEFAIKKIKHIDVDSSELDDIVQSYVDNMSKDEKWDYVEWHDIAPSEMVSDLIERHNEVENMLWEEFHNANKIEFNQYADAWLIDYGYECIEPTELLNIDDKNVTEDVLLDLISYSNLLNDYILDREQTLENMLYKKIKYTLNEIQNLEI